MRMPFDLSSQGLGSVQQRKRNMFSQELEQTKKRKPFKLCLVKRKMQISYKLKYDNNYNKFMFNSLGNSYIKTSYIMVIIHIK
jgi:hypothetical protein